MSKLIICKVNDLAEIPIRLLVKKSLEESFSFVERLEREYRSGKNRFDQRGEVLYAVFANTELVAVGGLNRDPFLDSHDTGRVRHLYVLPNYRKQGIGKELVEKIVKEAKLHFRLLTLRTFNENADRFYQAIGFHRTSEIESASHFLVLSE
ncbi:MAG: GNAT family N-acetyltransferase [Chloroflexi bacterium]|nr:GNAT family N-acetyltransferase [Chloroflexota bacterium]